VYGAEAIFSFTVLLPQPSLLHYVFGTAEADSVSFLLLRILTLQPGAVVVVQSTASIPSSLLFTVVVVPHSILLLGSHHRLRLPSQPILPS